MDDTSSLMCLGDTRGMPGQTVSMDSGSVYKLFTSYTFRQCNSAPIVCSSMASSEQGRGDIAMQNLTARFTIGRITASAPLEEVRGELAESLATLARFKAHSEQPR
jgi:hypothetical protein